MVFDINKRLINESKFYLYIKKIVTTNITIQMYESNLQFDLRKSNIKPSINQPDQLNHASNNRQDTVSTKLLMSYPKTLQTSNEPYPWWDHKCTSRRALRSRPSSNLHKCGNHNYITSTRKFTEKPIRTRNTKTRAISPIFSDRLKLWRTAVLRGCFHVYQEVQNEP